MGRGSLADPNVVERFVYWSGGGHAHAETYYPSAKGGQKGDPFFVVVAWSRGCRRGHGREEWCESKI